MTSEQQTVFCNQINSKSIGESKIDQSQIQRRNANYKPNIWNYDIMLSLKSQYSEGKYKTEAQKLKEEVLRLLAEIVNPLAKLEFIDSINKMALSHLFDKEIMVSLQHMEYAKKKDSSSEMDLYFTALHFRIFRQYGYNVPQDVFLSYMNEMGDKFEVDANMDPKTMVQLFEASHLALKDENMLNEARIFCNKNLKSSNNIIPMEMPLHWKVEWYNTKRQISKYENEERESNLKLLQLAKLNFNMVQAQHQKDLVDILRWDPKEVEQLPSCMKICFWKLYDTTNDVATTLRLQRRSIDMLEGCLLTMDIRRSGNYKPSIWEDGYVQSRANLYIEEKYCERAEKLKEEVRRMLEKTMTHSLEQLELIDILQRLGIYYHFEEEIDRVLKKIYVNYNKGDHHGQKNELYATALEFRLLRQHGHHAPQEIFHNFMNEEGKFKTILIEDIKGLLSLYEASYLSMEGENIMETARDFATHYLTECLKKKINENLAEQVSHALEMPVHWRMERLEARWFIEVYYKEENMNPLLLELSKLDYNIVQATYLEELKQMSRWDKNIKLVKKISFVRDRLVEGFFWAVGFTPNPQFGYCRKFSTKLSVLLTTIDDIYDVYGTLDELELFTDIVDRWDINAIEQLPEYMQICFLALFNSMNELVYDILKEQGFSIISHIRKQWANLCKAYLLEVRWYQRGYTPSLDEFLRNAWITNTGPVLIMHAYFCITNPIKEEELECLKHYPAIIYSPSLILRLVNDLATSPDEIKKGDYLKSIQCYMHESRSSEENARNYIKNLIDQTWKKMNGDILRDQSFSKDFRRTAINLARIAQCMYQHGDGFGIPDRETKNRILSLFFEPIPLS